MSGSGDRPGPKSFEIPDLDLPPPRASQSSLRAVVPSESGRLPVSGSARAARPTSPLADDGSSETGAGGAQLDLELEGPISRGEQIPGIAQGVQFADDSFELDSVKAPPLTGLIVAPEGRANWPTGVTPARENLVLDPIEVRVLADYGTPPSLGPLAVVYALRVTLRKNALKTQLRRVERELAEAEAARDTRLAELAERRLPELRSSVAFRTALAPLAEVDDLTRDRERALSATSADHTAEVGQLDAEIAATRRDLETERAARDELARTLESREQTLRRVEARHKRCLIEMRGIEQQAVQRLGPGGGEMPPDLFAQLAPLKAQADALRPELEQARAAHEAARAEHDARGSGIKQLELRASEFERKKGQLEERFRRQLGVRKDGLGETGARRQAVLADVGRTVLAARGGVTVEEPTLEALREADTAVRRLAQKSELHLHAIDAYDSEKVNTGIAWILGGVALLGAYVAYRQISE